MRGVARAATLSALFLVAAAVAAQAFAAGPDAKASAAVAAPIEFAGTLESGKTYVAEVFFDNNALHIWRPAKDVQVPRNHAWTIDWTNLVKFPALKSAATRARPQRFQFKVAGVDVSSGSPMIPWTTVYRCEIIAFEPVAGAAAAAIRRK